MKIFERLFKKKEEQVVIPEKPKKMDLSMYKMKLSVKAICMYEKLSGKSFFDFENEDIAMLLYCTFYTSNELEIKYETFIGILDNEQIARWATLKYKDILDVLQQFPKKENTDTVANKTDDDAKMTMTDLATSLIIDYHMDAHYVMYEMNIWEIEPLYGAADAMVKRRYEEERLWAYIDIMPHIDGKKVKGPETLLPFPWEKDMKKKKIEKNMQNNLYAVKHTIGMNIDDIINGKRGLDDNIGREGLSEDADNPSRNE